MALEADKCNKKKQNKKNKPTLLDGSTCVLCLVLLLLCCNKLL